MKLDEITKLDRTYHGLQVYELDSEHWAVGAAEEIPQAVGRAVLELAGRAGGDWTRALEALVGEELAEFVVAAAEAERSEPFTSLLVYAL